MEHPLEKYRQQQARFLEQQPEEDRPWHARFFRIANASYWYHRQGLNEPTKEDFKEWLEGLPNHIRKDMEVKGFEGCKTALSFTRYVMEKRDIGMDEWMREHLSDDDYLYWKSQQ